MSAAEQALTVPADDAPAPADGTAAVARTLGWFMALLVAGLLVRDHGLGALARRLTQPRDAVGGTAALAGLGAPAAPARGEDDPDGPDPTAGPTGGPREAGGGGPAGGGGGRPAAAAFLEDACVAPAGAAPEACARWATDGFTEAVARSRAGTLGRAVRASFYGDSVIANDEIPGRLRARLQADLGDGGPGFVFASPPHRFCAHAAIQRALRGAWTTHAISTTLVGDDLYGVGGSTAEAVDGAVALRLVAGRATRAELYYLEQPGGGGATLLADGAEVLRVASGAPAKRGAFAAAAIPAGAARFELRAEGRLRVFGLTLENEAGAVVDNLGIVSVNAKNLARNRADHRVAQLAHRGADLVLVMIGANEAQWLAPGDQDTREYQARYEAVLAPIRAARPDATCLVVSPTDQATAAPGGYPSRPVMPLLVEAQRQAARAQGCAFFSTYAWMGGKGAAEAWFRRGLVGSDFQHLSTRGATKLADAVLDALIATGGSRARR